jgi:hypothetical protein
MLRTSLVITLSIGRRSARRERGAGAGVGIKGAARGSILDIVDRRFLRAGALALLLLLLPCLRVPAETFLVIVMETRDGEPARPPCAAREGILTALFDDGQIAFELPPGETPPSFDDLPRLGFAAGAGIVAVIVVDWHEESPGAGGIGVTCRGHMVLIDPVAGLRTDPIPLELGNEGRERTVGRTRLGLEIGASLIRAWQAWLVRG